uniref:Uncharacterized protein n=1 Tax=Rhizobium rhizogenes TaxID=359 RepID=A0A7S4ZT67_RHIRH|nr:hypothetical protein pC6.5b_251 [Rhizobium rhizogenes]
MGRVDPSQPPPGGRNSHEVMIPQKKWEMVNRFKAPNELLDQVPRAG